MARAKELIERSFGQYLSDLAFAPARNRLDALASEIETLQQELSTVDLAALTAWEKLRERLREERRLFKILQEQSEETRLTAQAAWVPYALTGSLLAFRTPVESWQTAVLVAKIPGSGQFPWLICLDRTNTWYVLACKDVLALGDVWWSEDVPYPADLTLRPGCARAGESITAELAKKMPLLPLPALAPEVQAQQVHLEALEQELSRHPVNTWGDRKGIVRKQRRLEDLQTERQREQQQQERPQHYWQEFAQLMRVLQAHNFLVGDRPTLPGQAAAALRGDNELWLALAIDSGELDRLKPHHFAGVCAALVTEENGRPDSWTRFGVSPTLEDALEGLRSHRRRLEEVQRQHKVYVPVWLDWNAAALVEQWALEISWQELWQNTSLDEGDLVRIVRRTLDLLCQLPHVPHLSEDLRDTARAAAIAIDRFPVSEVI
ncbi:MAG: RNA helicase, partial [Oscillatoriales cyanobacterium SM2_2_1]|nr:RNA helicase [Oscillatoriales cyanobacterium SM2_2_1]